MLYALFAFAPVFEAQDPMDVRNIAGFYERVDIALTQGQLSGYPLLSRSITSLDLARAGLPDTPRPEGGLWIPLSARGLASPLAGRFILPFQFGFKRGGLVAYENLALFSGPRDFSRLSPWDPRHDPRWEIQSWDTQPIVGKNHIVEERQLRGYGGYFWDWAYITVGRELLRMGPSYRYAMGLSGFAGPLDFFYHLRVLAGPMKFSAGFARVPDTLDSRRITYQRVEWAVLPNLGLAATEGVLSTRADLAKYANPFLFFHDIQRHESDNQDNLFASGEVSWRVIPGIRVYGEVFMDDPTFISGGEAAMYAFSGGVQLCWGEWDIRAETGAASPYTYAHLSDSNAMSALGWPMGFWLGPDSWALYGHLAWGTGPLRIKGFCETIWHGELWLDTPYEAVGGEGPSWPTGTVENSVEPGAEASFVGSWLSLKLRASYYSARHYMNREHESLSGPRFGAYIAVVPKVLHFSLD